MSNLEKINVLTKNKLDSLDLTQYPNQIFGTTDEVAEGGGSGVVDSELSETSENPVQNKVIARAILDVEHIETIYDMTSSDSTINKGYTSGLQANNLATNYQFGMLASKYKAFIVYGRLDSMSTSTRIDLALKIGTQVAGGLICGNYATNNFAHSTYNMVVDVNSGVFKTWHAQYMAGSSQVSKDNNSEYIITKIEGVLK